MSLENLLIYSEQIKNEAETILQENSILEILSFCEEVLIVGGYSLNLMYDKDIDIIIKSKDLKKDSLDCLNKFINIEKFSKVEYGDFVKFPKKNRPNGYIINLHIQNEKKLWEIEIWFLNDIEEYKIQLKNLKRLINEKNKIQILNEKNERNRLGLDKNQLSSYEIYKNFLGEF